MSIRVDLIEIALRDIRSSILLYNEKMFAQSYFLFQQASEKANKAFGLHYNIINEDELKKEIQHNQLKIYRKAIVTEAAEMKNLSEQLNNNPQFSNHDFLKNKPFEQHAKNLNDGLKFHDSAKNLDLLNYSNIDLEQYLDCIEELYKIRITRSKKVDKLITQELKNLKDFSDKFYPEKDRKEMEEAFNSGNREEVLNMIYKVSQYQMKFLFMNYTFYFCALITIRHSNIARYPDNSISPINFYNLKNPSVKYQPYFMRFLKIACERLKKEILEEKENDKSPII